MMMMMMIRKTNENKEKGGLKDFLVYQFFGISFSHTDNILFTTVDSAD